MKSCFWGYGGLQPRNHVSRMTNGSVSPLSELQGQMFSNREKWMLRINGAELLLSCWTLFSTFLWTSESFQFWLFCASRECAFLCSKKKVITLNVQCVVVVQMLDSVRKNMFYYRDFFWLAFVKTNFSICRHETGELWDFCKPLQTMFSFLSPHRWMWNCRSDFWAFGCSRHPSLLHQYF